MPGQRPSVAVIGGDGIGPDVVAEALKVVEASGVRLETDQLRTGRGPLLGDRRGAAGPGPRGAAGLRRDPSRRRRASCRFARGPPGLLERGCLLRLRFELDLYVNLRPFLGIARGTEP